MTVIEPERPLLADTRRCGYCNKPAEGRLARLLPENRSSLRVDLTHPQCYREFMADLVLMSDGVPGALPAAGWCHRCSKWSKRARVVAEIQSNSGPGSVVLRCLACCQPGAAEPLTVPLHAYVVEDC